jgi:hypothetical protein
MSEPKSRPLIFTCESVRGILAGTKTMTRRVVKPQPDTIHDGVFPYWRVGGYRAWRYIDSGNVLRKGGKDLICPYGVVGDRIWCRERFLPCKGVGHEHPVRIEDASFVCFLDGSQKYRDGHYFQEPPRDIPPSAWPDGGVFRSLLFMPRWASRITLELTGVRVERLQSISEADARAEGIVWNEGPFRDGHTNHISAYKSLWNKVNGKKYPWESNAWVWVLEFKVVADAQPSPTAPEPSAAQPRPATGPQCGSA